MAQLTWGDLLKAQDDSETIEQAIARLIQEHDDDETAHLETGQSIEAHKSAEVIDHLAGSIVQDKLSLGFFNPYILHGSFQSLDSFYVSAANIDLNLAGVTLITNTSLNNQASISSKGNTDQDLLYNNSPILELPVKIWAQGTYEAYFGIGDRDGYYDEYFCGFKITGGSLYAYMYSEGVGNATSSALTGVDVTERHLYRIEYEVGVGAIFYIDGVYKATIAQSYLDDQNTAIYYASIKTTQAGNQAGIWLWPFNLLYAGL